jgi:hypothetical protein
MGPRPFDLERQTFERLAVMNTTLVADALASDRWSPARVVIAEAAVTGQHDRAARFKRIVLAVFVD